MEFPDGCVVLEQCGESSESRRLAGSMFEEREVKKGVEASFWRGNCTSKKIEMLESEFDLLVPCSCTIEYRENSKASSCNASAGTK